MRKIVSKFQCFGVEPAEQGYPTTARLNAVYANSDGTVNEENKSFSEATPSGNIEMQISQKVPAHKFFTPNRYYKVTFELLPMTEQEIENEKVYKMSPKEQRDYWEEKTGVKQDYPLDKK
jgi:hypothetical protein